MTAMFKKLLSGAGLTATDSENQPEPVSGGRFKASTEPWELRLLDEMRDEEAAFWSVSWNPSTLYELVASFGNSVMTWSLQTALLGIAGNMEHYSLVDEVSEVHKRICRQVKFAQGGDRFIVAGFDGHSTVWTRLEDSGGNVYYRMAGEQLEGHENEVKSAGISACGKYVATCSRDKSVWIYELVQDGIYDCINVLNSHTGDVKYLTWHPTDPVLLTCSYDKNCCLFGWDGEDFALIQTLTGHNDTVWQASFHPQGNLVATASQDKTLAFWSNHLSSNSSKNPAHWYVQPTFGQAGHLAKVSTASSEQNWQQVGKIDHDDAVFCCEWNPVYDDILCTGCGDDQIRIFRVVLDQPWRYSLLFNVRGHLCDINSLGWNSTGRLLASAGGDGKLRIWALVDTSKLEEDASQGLPEDLAEVWSVMRPEREKMTIVPWVDRADVPQDEFVEPPKKSGCCGGGKCGGQKI